MRSKAMIDTLKKQARAHAKTAPAASFVLGFLFDMITLGRIDSWAMIAQQGAYLLIVGGLVVLELWEKAGCFAPPSRLERAWAYQEGAVHFFLGSLLSAYTLFYFKSASLFTAFVFLFLLSALLIANEFSRFRSAGIALRAAMLSLCAASYFIYTVPILFGFIGVSTFLCALVISLLLAYACYRVMRQRVLDRALLRRQVVYPVCTVHVALLALYFLRAIPPVPLSVNYMGIYHDVSREGNQFKLTYTRPSWKFWEHGDQTFEYHEGDQLFGFASIFSPTGFQEQVNVRWLYKEPRAGWQTQDVIPIEIKGGRDEGFRGYTRKKHFRPGNWRFQVETGDGREIGRLYFIVRKALADRRGIPKTEIR